MIASINKGATRTQGPVTQVTVDEKIVRVNPKAHVLLWTSPDRACPAWSKR